MREGSKMAKINLNHAVKGPAVVRLSSALLGSAGKVPDHPEGHDLVVNSLRIYDLAR
jgi:hypothetical protein